MSKPPVDKAPRPRLCIQCGAPITHGVFVPVPAVGLGPYERIQRFVCYHLSCLPPALRAAGYKSITVHETR